MKEQVVVTAVVWDSLASLIIYLASLSYLLGESIISLYGKKPI